MCDWAINCLANQLQVKFIKMIPNHHTRITRFSTHHRYSDGTNLEKKTPPCHVGKAKGSGDYLLCSKAVCSTILVEWFEDSWLNSIRLPLTWSSGGSSNLVHPWWGHGPWPEGTYAWHGYTLKGCTQVNPNDWAASGEHGHHIQTRKHKTNTITDTNI